jgi:nitrogen fixation/metabolism regulation signal transduction histidine kinase
VPIALILGLIGLIVATLLFIAQTLFAWLKNAKTGSKKIKKYEQMVMKFPVILVHPIVIIVISGMIFSMSTIPFSYLDADTHHQLPAIAFAAHRLSEPYHIVSNYGLFARYVCLNEPAYTK